MKLFALLILAGFAAAVLHVTGELDTATQAAQNLAQTAAEKLKELLQ